ncbi:protein of unknown function [Micromonospora rhizosphaerae]|uniref:DUF4352 domain-containing protein n=1 Tax=Micromonospora rhizosphaerae TaxID=568872 RepID=A0A1C6T3F0_9ACTN|nr:DUF4352 domain-containing protein [Micromonospora rhizosphaerae]SCL35935.1 protein of unknown function [Micromonospora rhizosphaerae]
MTMPGDPSQNQPNPDAPAGGPAPYGPPPSEPAPYGPPPTAQFPAVAPPRKRPAWLVPTAIGVGALVLLCCGIGAVGAVFSDPKPASVSASEPPAVAAPTTAPAAPAPATTAPATTAPATTAPAPAKPKTFGIGDKVRGGDFEYTVNSVKCGISQVGTSFLNTKAQGTFCRVNVTAKNVTKSAHTFHADSILTAQDASGREYSPDGEAGMYGNEDAKGFLDEINPGNSVRANVYFDVPKGTKLKTITFDAGLLTLAEDAVVTL